MLACTVWLAHVSLYIFGLSLRSSLHCGCGLAIMHSVVVPCIAIRLGTLASLCHCISSSIICPRRCSTGGSAHGQCRCDSARLDCSAYRHVAWVAHLADIHNLQYVYSIIRIWIHWNRDTTTSLTLKLDVPTMLKLSND